MRVYKEFAHFRRSEPGPNSSGKTC